jgi:hypothetical protein
LGQIISWTHLGIRRIGTTAVRNRPDPQQGEIENQREMEMPIEMNQDRRRFFGTAAIAAAAAQLGLLNSAVAHAGDANPGATAAVTAGQGANTSFGALKQINAGLLNIGYAEAGPANGPAVILLHGWPYDITVLWTSHRCWRRRAIG